METVSLYRESQKPLERRAAHAWMGGVVQRMVETLAPQAGSVTSKRPSAVVEGGDVPEYCSGRSLTHE